MTSGDDPTHAGEVLADLNPHHLFDARAVVRLFQCQQCSYPIREPMTLPCGNSLCRPCMPPMFKRENISYPIDPKRNEGFICPFKECGLQHTMGDCSLDVTLNKIVELVRSSVEVYRAETSDTPLLLEEKLHIPNILESGIDVMPRSRVLHGGKVVATYILADMGELHYSSDVDYTAQDSDTAEQIEALDVAVVNNLREIVRGELECQVCYTLILDPLTTACGHTFCRKCVARMLDHSNLCPACRRRLTIPPGVQLEPTNKRTSNILSILLPEMLAARIAASEQEDTIDEETSMPLFPCTLAYPQMPTFLHIFEPRYRLMIRRTLESGTRKFGILSYNSSRQPQGALGVTQFMQYGTVLDVQRVEMFADGRSLVETVGAYRFRVLDHSQVDGYIVGRTQRIDDIPLAEEEAIEARETSGPEPDVEDVQGRFNHMSTQQLLQYGMDFIATARTRSAPWLQEHVLAAYGQPPTDPAIFPYWFASVLPISEAEKYLLLPTTSVRERLKLTARWIHRLEVVQRMQEAGLIRIVFESSSEDGQDSETETEMEATNTASDAEEIPAVPDEEDQSHEEATGNPNHSTTPRSA